MCHVDPANPNQAVHTARKYRVRRYIEEYSTP